MSLLASLGLKVEDVGKGSVEEAHAALNEFLTRVDPLLRDFSNRLGGIAHGLLDRVKLKGHIEFEIIPLPKAEAVEPSQTT